MEVYSDRDYLMLYKHEMDAQKFRTVKAKLPELRDRPKNFDPKVWEYQNLQQELTFKQYVTLLIKMINQAKAKDSAYKILFQIEEDNSVNCFFNQELPFK